MFREVKLCGTTIAMSKSEIVPHHYRESVLKAVSRIAHYIRFSFQKQFPDSVRNPSFSRTIMSRVSKPTCSKRNDLLVAWFVNERAQSMVTYVVEPMLLFAYPAQWTMNVACRTVQHRYWILKYLIYDRLDFK